VVVVIAISNPYSPAKDLTECDYTEYKTRPGFWKQGFSRRMDEAAGAGADHSGRVFFSRLCVPFSQVSLVPPKFLIALSGQETMNPGIPNPELREGISWTSR
jgi:hypothetical protein